MIATIARMTFAGGLAIGALAVGENRASATPAFAHDLAIEQHGVQQARWVCGPYRCWWRQGWGYPYYGPSYWRWRRHYEHPYDYWEHPYGGWEEQEED